MSNSINVFPSLSLSLSLIVSISHYLLAIFVIVVSKTHTHNLSLAFSLAIVYFHSQNSRVSQLFIQMVLCSVFRVFAHVLTLLNGRIVEDRIQIPKNQATGGSETSSMMLGKVAYKTRIMSCRYVCLRTWKTNLLSSRHVFHLLQRAWQQSMCYKPERRAWMTKCQLKITLKTKIPSTDESFGFWTLWGGHSIDFCRKRKRHININFLLW